MRRNPSLKQNVVGFFPPNPHFWNLFASHRRQQLMKRQLTLSPLLKRQSNWWCAATFFFAPSFACPVLESLRLLCWHLKLGPKPTAIVPNTSLLGTILQHFRVNDSFRCSIHIHVHIHTMPYTSMHTIHKHAFLSMWHKHCRPNLFLQMLFAKNLWKNESLKRRDIVQESWAYYTCACSLQVWEGFCCVHDIFKLGDRHRAT